MQSVMTVQFANHLSQTSVVETKLTGSKKT